MKISLSQAFKNVDSVIASAKMTREEHGILLNSLQVIKEATTPLKVFKPVCENCPKGATTCTCEGDENGGADDSPND